MPVVAGLSGAMTHFVVRSRDRKRLVASGPPVIRKPEDAGYSKSQGTGQRDEIPQRGKSQNEDESAPGCEQQSDKSAAERQVMHGNAGMPFFGHKALPSPLIMLSITSSYKGRPQQWRACYIAGNSPKKPRKRGSCEGKNSCCCDCARIGVDFRS